ncbi:PREDICTED: uncharacterized protein LOC108377829 [Rhagoletis zephyria]|uniref:uncharacterized protein LOC108377829 n=1 Tax=Rhagoletis zephyria TaxID=28612 RepID=UPI0008118F94|nr:PREDICTED: uncharacterized protein LOC108377829 [Rhagoletis zephyria]
MNSGQEFDSQLTEDFLLFLDLCPHPNKVFQPNSEESCLAIKWLDKLCRYECADLGEQRMRNIYMSYLCCCLIEGALKGPFASQPRGGRLQSVQSVDFNATKKQPLSCPSPMRVKPYKECDDGKSSPGNDNCDQQLGSCCFSNDGGGGGSFNGARVSIGSSRVGVRFGGGSTTRELMRCGPEVHFSPDIQCDSDMGMKPTTGNIFNKYVLGEITAPSAFNSFASNYDASCDSCQEYDPYWQAKQTIRQDAATLLEAIRAELRGEVGSNCNDYLESELVRYKNFIMNFSSIAFVLDTLKSLPALRTFLLINLQNDLIKLITDNCR